MTWLSLALLTATCALAIVFDEKRNAYRLDEMDGGRRDV